MSSTSEPHNREAACVECQHPASQHYDMGCGWCICRVPGPAADADTVKIPQELVTSIMALCSYVGDHGGGEREHLDGASLPCPSCAANAIAIDLAGPGWTHERGSSQCRIFARAPEGTPFPPYYAALVKAKR